MVSFPLHHPYVIAPVNCAQVDIEWVRANTIVGALASIERSEEEDDGESEQRRRSGSRRGGGPATVRGSTLDTIDESD